MGPGFAGGSEEVGETWEMRPVERAVDPTR